MTDSKNIQHNDIPQIEGIILYIINRTKLVNQWKKYLNEKLIIHSYISIYSSCV
ncbi:hypothetical protein IJ182_08150 [bacterium]|nr:hypothetical protein [bacterium]